MRSSLPFLKNRLTYNRVEQDTKIFTVSVSPPSHTTVRTGRYTAVHQTWQ